MKIAEFKYHRPKTIKEACELKEKLKDSSFLAGGTFLIPLSRRTNTIEKNIISLKSIPQLSELSLRRTTLTIGSMVTMDDLCSDVLVKEKIPLLSEVASYVSSSQIRNMASVGGNLCCGLPWTDLAIVLLVLDAQIEISGSKSSESLNIAEFLKAPKLAIKNRLLKNIKIKIPSLKMQYAFVRIPKDTDRDIPLVSVCVAIKDKEKNKPEVVFAVNFGNRFPTRLTNIEKLYKNNSHIRWDGQLENKISEEVEGLESSAYRRDIILTCFKRAVEKLNHEA